MSSETRRRKRPKLPTLQPSHSEPRAGTSNQDQDSNSSWITTIKSTRAATNRNFMSNETLVDHTSPNTASPSQSLSKPLTSSESLPLPVTGNMDTRQTQEVHDSDNVLGKRKRKRARVYTAKSRLIQWLEHRDTTLDEILRHDGLGSFTGSGCSGCNAEATGIDDLFRCKDCGHGTALLCRTCLLSNHVDLPLHRTECWNGKFFVKTPLSTLGLRLQLGHDGRPCPCPVPGPPGFKVFDTSGVHAVNVDFCGCNPERPKERYVQLLRMRWFPATNIRPQTAFTFDCLDTFHESTLQGKGNLYDFYHMLLRKTDNANLGVGIYRFPEIHRAFRLWRNMMAWKRSGRGQDPTGIDGTDPGGTIVECPACPHPKKNLPDNWMQAGSLLYLYTLFIAVDANFKLKGKERKLDDVDLIPGTGVFVEQNAYQKHIANYVEQPEINTCQSEHDAIVRASIRSTPGYAVSGVGLVLCSRHSLVRKNGVGDLQKGERYCNLDFIILSAVLGVALACIFITYDIACQWSKNFKKRMIEFPEKMRIPGTTKIKTAVPSWHINDHGASCRNNFNLGYTPGVGRTCGEEVEAAWSHTNPLAASVREMAPAARRDALNDHWNGWNFRKIVGFRPAFKRKLKEALKMVQKHEKLFKDLTATFKTPVIKEWVAAVERWEKDPKQPNPYEEPDSTLSLQKLRLELLKEEEDADAKASKNEVVHKITMTSFLVGGLELEIQQYKLRVEVTKRKAITTKTQADIQEKRISLLRKIYNWRKTQVTYTPYAAVLLAQNMTVDENGIPRTENAENVPLYLPSSFPADVIASPKMKRIVDMEARLRKAAANDALFEIRRGRRNVTKLWKHKKVNVSGTGNRPNTRMLTMYTRLNNKIDRAAHKYRRARLALTTLQPDNAWAGDFPELKKEDIRGPGKDPDDKKASNGRFEESWIWIAQRTGKKAEEETKEYKEDMRVDWVKSRARLLRWKEEVFLVREEMRRVIEWSEWKACWWDEQAFQQTTGSEDILSGVRAYAQRQAAMWREMAMQCAWAWLPTLRELGQEPGWASRYPKDEKSGSQDCDTAGGEGVQGDRAAQDKVTQEEGEEGEDEEGLGGGDEDEDEDEEMGDGGDEDFDDFEYDD